MNVIPRHRHVYRQGDQVMQRLDSYHRHLRAGKSTAARYFAGEFTGGTLPGVLEGQQQNVAYIAAEEPLDLIVKPSLRASGAD